MGDIWSVNTNSRLFPIHYFTKSTFRNQIKMKTSWKIVKCTLMFLWSIPWHQKVVITLWLGKPFTGISLSEALIFASTNPQYDDRLFVELQAQYMTIPSLNLGRTCCVQNLFLTFRTIIVHNMFSPFSAKRRASDKD